MLTLSSQAIEGFYKPAREHEDAGELNQREEVFGAALRACHETTEDGVHRHCRTNHNPQSAETGPPPLRDDPEE